MSTSIMTMKMVTSSRLAAPGLYCSVMIAPCWDHEREGASCSIIKSLCGYAQHHMDYDIQANIGDLAICSHCTTALDIGTTIKLNFALKNQIHCIIFQNRRMPIRNDILRFFNDVL